MEEKTMFDEEEEGTSPSDNQLCYYQPDKRE